MPAKERNQEYKRVVVKIGSNVLAGADGLPDLNRMREITRQIGELIENEVEVILVSSGAVSFGRSKFDLPENTDTVSRRQILAAIGQVEIIQAYKNFFMENNVICSQVVVTKEDFRSRKHYLNMRNCLAGLIQNGILAIVNENDVVSVTELMFTDNDELAGMVSAMMNADALIILSNVDGIMDRDPKEEGAQVIHNVAGENQNIESVVSTNKSSFGRGGMKTKIGMAKKTAGLGIPVFIANGTKNNILIKLLSGETEGTFFPAKRNKKPPKKWLAHAETYVTASVTVNTGAKEALLSDQATSLLPVGIVTVSGNFNKGDVIQVIDEEGKSLGIGKTEYGFQKALERIGKQNQKPLIHYDYLYLHQ